MTFGRIGIASNENLCNATIRKYASPSPSRVRNLFNVMRALNNNILVK